jgi:YggT family protein
MSPASPSLLLVVVLALATRVTASIFLPGGSGSFSSSLRLDALSSSAFHRRRCLDRAIRRSSLNVGTGMSNNIHGAGQHSTTTPFLLAMAIPGNSLPEQIIIGGFGNFISIYNTVITGRILLSWFPQAAGVAALRPIYQITDPYLNLFRGIIPPIFGLDLSPILAFVTLNLLQSSSISLAATTTMMDDDEGKSVNGSGIEKGTMMMSKSSIKVTNKVGKWGHLTTMK